MLPSLRARYNDLTILGPWVLAYLPNYLRYHRTRPLQAWLKPAFFSAWAYSFGYSIRSWSSRFILLSPISFYTFPWVVAGMFVDCSLSGLSFSVIQSVFPLVSFSWSRSCSFDKSGFSWASVFMQSTHDRECPHRKAYFLLIFTQQDQA